VQQAEDHLSLVCGPSGALPEAHQRYRLLEHLGTGGQAYAYRAVRLSGGIRSGPVVVKVFRAGATRPLVDQLRAWDKGDAVLMDLNGRDVPGICRRVDGFTGLPPHQPGAPDPAAGPVPYQVLDFLPGVTLRQRLGSGPPLSGRRVLSALAATLEALHHPREPGLWPVLHMDVKPSNVLVLPDGSVRLIDFTGSRYAVRSHITSIAFSEESGGPEAYSGEVGPPYDVHGFGAVAFFLLTGDFPRGSEPALLGDPTVPVSVPHERLRRHPVLSRHPELCRHLLAPLADRPEDRPPTPALRPWVDRLAVLAAGLPAGAQLVDWAAPAPARGRSAVPAPAGEPQQAAPAGERPPQPAPPLVGRARVPGPPPHAAAGPPPLHAAAGPPPPWAPPASSFRPPLTLGGALPTPGASPGAGGPAAEPTGPPAPPPPWSGRGRRLTVWAVRVTVACWLVWLVAAIASPTAELVEPVVGLALALGSAALVFVLSRVAGRVLLTDTLGRVRHSAVLSHAATAGFLLCWAAAFLSRTPLSLERLPGLVSRLF